MAISPLATVIDIRNLIWKVSAGCNQLFSVFRPNWCSCFGSLDQPLENHQIATERNGETCDTKACVRNGTFFDICGWPAIIVCSRKHKARPRRSERHEIIFPRLASLRACLGQKCLVRSPIRYSVQIFLDWPYQASPKQSRCHTVQRPWAEECHRVLSIRDSLWLVASRGHRKSRSSDSSGAQCSNRERGTKHPTCLSS